MPKNRLFRWKYSSHRSGQILDVFEENVKKKKRKLTDLCQSITLERAGILQKNIDLNSRNVYSDVNIGTRWIYMWENMQRLGTFHSIVIVSGSNALQFYGNFVIHGFGFCFWNSWSNKLSLPSKGYRFESIKVNKQLTINYNSYFCFFNIFSFSVLIGEILRAY